MSEDEIKKILLYLCVSFITICTCCTGGNDGKAVGKTRTVVDASERDVSLPDTVKRVVSPFTMYTRLITAIGGCDRLVGISHTCLLPEEQHGCSGRLSELPDVGQFGANIELIASLDPDLIFASERNIATFREKTDASVVSVSFPDDTPMLDMFNSQIDIIGKALGMESEAEELERFMDSVISPVKSVTKDMTDSVKPVAYFAWTSWTGDILNTVAEFDPIGLAGGINAAGEASDFAKGERGILVSKEHIIKWDPDVIFLSRYQRQKWHDNGNTSPLPVTVKDVLEDPMLQGVSAVKNSRVYYTTAFCNWWPHQRALIQIIYMAKIFHPDKFRELNAEKTGNKIFKKFYGADSLYTEMAEDLELKTWN